MRRRERVRRRPPTHPRNIFRVPSHPGISFRGSIDDCQLGPWDPDGTSRLSHAISLVLSTLTGGGTLGWPFRGIADGGVPGVWFQKRIAPSPRLYPELTIPPSHSTLNHLYTATSNGTPSLSHPVPGVPAETHQSGKFMRRRRSWKRGSSRRGSQCGCTLI